jgi:hypothetical protein
MIYMTDFNFFGRDLGEDNRKSANIVDPLMLIVYFYAKILYSISVKSC